MSAWLTFRLAVWRELRTRGGLFLVLAGCAAVGPFLRDREAAGWDLFVLTMVLPALLAFSAAGGSAAPDPFWRALGGPSWARAIAAPAVHVFAFGLPILAMAGLGLDGPHSLPAYLALLFAGYGCLRAARALTSGVTVLFGPLLGGVLLAGSIGVGELLRLWPLEETVGVRLVGLGIVGMALAFRLDVRFGSWGARRAAARLLMLVLGGTFAGGALAEVASGAAADSGANVADFDATRVLRSNWRGRDWTANAWLTMEQGGQTIDLGPGRDGALGPHGAWVVGHGTERRATDGLLRTDMTALDLHGPTGEVRCPLDARAGCWSWTWRPDGDAVAAICGDDGWVADARAGCERVPGGSVAWLGDEEVVAHDAVVTVGGREVGRIPARVSLVGGEGAVLAVALWSDGRAVWRIDGAGVYPLFDGREGRAYAADGAVCARAWNDSRSVCWRPDGATVEGDGAFLDPTHLLDPTGHVVTELEDGRRWTLPGAERWYGGSLRFVAPDEVLLPWGGKFVRIKPDP